MTHCLFCYPKTVCSFSVYVTFPSLSLFSLSLFPRDKKEKQRRKRKSLFSSPSLTHFSCHSIPSSFFHFRVNKNLSFFQRFCYSSSVDEVYFCSSSSLFSFSSLFLLPHSFFGTKEGEKKNEGKSRTNIFREQKEEGNRNEKERKRKRKREKKERRNS